MKYFIILTLALFVTSCKEEKKYALIKAMQEQKVVQQEEKTNIVKECSKCFKPAGEEHICGVTGYCYKCNRDTYQNHICSITRPCKKCLQEVGSGHICGITRLCPYCNKEVAKNHFTEFYPGKTQKCLTKFCPYCRKDVGENHKTDLKTKTCLTYFCPNSTCKREVGENHLCGFTEFCETCLDDVSKYIHCAEKTSRGEICGEMLSPRNPSLTTPLPENIFCKKCGKYNPIQHICGLTYFCKTCKSEVEIIHKH